MTTYFIDFTDPLKTGFSILPGAYNGPGNANAKSSLRLYGRGALEWGESVDENMLRLTENFAGATPPGFPLNGQLWKALTYYWANTSAATWFRFNPDTAVWTDITSIVTGGTVGTGTAPVGPAVGTYWYTAGSAPAGTDCFGKPLKATTLYRWDQAYKQQAVGWMERINKSATTSPTVFGDVDQALKVYDSLAGIWQPLLSAGLADSTYVRLNGANTPMTGFLTLNANPTAALHAAPKQYVDTTVATALGNVSVIWDNLSTSAKQGDIAVVAGKGYLRVAGVWHEFYPACCAGSPTPPPPPPSPSPPPPPAPSPPPPPPGGGDGSDGSDGAGGE